jgi:hypothetical protein
MRYLSRSVFGLLLCTALYAAALDPFPLDWRDQPPSPADVSFLLEAPAGKSGFVRAAGGRLTTGDGKRFRIWGVNFTAAATVPPKEDAPAVAAYLARYGLNCVRFHFLDRPAPSGLIDAKRDDTRAFDPAYLDRFDFFVAELKKRGIYTNINLNVGRTYKPGDGVRDHELLGFAKALTYFDPRLLELQREYARGLLTHFNPYTKSEYRHEPAVAIVELVNENSIVESWFSDRLLGKNTTRNPGTWTDIPASYEAALTGLYHSWLRSKGLPPVARLRRAEFEKADRDRFHREAEFYMEIERKYFQEMGAYLKNTLGVKSLIAGTSDHNHGNSGYPLLASASLLDIVDGHVYWQHPRYLTDPKTGKRTGFEIGNTPMVNDPLNSTVVQLSRSAMAGKPYTVSEVNHPFPAEYACEGIPILAAYASLHDWDGVFWYTFEHSPPSAWKPAQPGHFDIRPDPVKMAELAAGALVFLRGDVRPARRTVLRSYSMEEVRESLRLPRSERPYFTPGFPLSAPLQHSQRIESFERSKKADVEPVSGAVIPSDTGELAWLRSQPNAGLVAVETPRSQALIGFVKTNARQTANLAVAPENEFCAVMLNSLDGKPIAQSAKMLLVAGGRVANTGMVWNDKRTSLLEWGKEPTVIETIRGALTLKGLAGARGITVRVLDSAGRPSGKPVAAKKTQAGWEFVLGATPTVWYFIEVKR